MQTNKLSFLRIKQDKSNDSNYKDEFYSETKSKKLNGAEYLRCLVNWLNCRIESQNENKSVLTLIDEFNKYRKTDDWIKDDNMTKEEFVNLFKHYAEEINNYVY
jgi:hypothetical protein